MRKCYVCGRTTNLHRHHVFEGSANRKKSEEYGMVIDLCGIHHNLSSDGIHFNKDLDLKVKREYQKKFEEKYGHDKFMEVFKRNYL